MNHIHSDPQTSEDLLRKYEPVLYFAPGEKFYPMRIEDFVEACQLKEYIKLRPDRLIQNKVKMDYFAANNDINPNLYLQFVHDPVSESWVWLSNLLNWIMPKYGKQVAPKLNQFIILSLWPLIISSLLVIGLIIAGVNLWVLIRLAIVIFLIFFGLKFRGVIRQTYFTVILNTFAILFIGSTLGIVVGVMALCITAGIFLFMGPRPRNRKQWILLLGGVCLLLIFAKLPFLLEYWPNYSEGLFLNSHGIEWLIYGTLLFLSIRGWSCIAKVAKSQSHFLWAIFLFILIIIIIGLTAVFGWDIFSSFSPTLFKNIPQLDNIIIFRICLFLAAICMITGILWLYLDPRQLAGQNKDAGERLCWSSDWNKGVTILAGIAIAIWLIASLIFQESDPISKLFLIVFIIILNLFFADLILRGKDIALFLSFGSGQSNSVAEKAAQRYADKRKESAEKWCYYGHVRTDPEENLITLQYHYFYAYNDWRMVADGINHHEGDWEAIVVYLHNHELYGVAYSTHNNGKFLFSEDLERNGLLENYTHPKAFVALGSHANYPSTNDTGIQPIGDQLSGTFEKLFIGYDRLVTHLHTWFEKLEYSTLDEETRIICPTIQLMNAESEWRELKKENRSLRERLNEADSLLNSSDHNRDLLKEEDKLIENIIKQGKIRKRMASTMERLVEETSNLSAELKFKHKQQNTQVEREDSSGQHMRPHEKAKKELSMLMKTQPITIETHDECKAKIKHLRAIGEDLRKRSEIHPMIKKARAQFDESISIDASNFLTNEEIGKRIVFLTNEHKDEDKLSISSEDIRKYQEKSKPIMAGLFNDITQYGDNGLIIGVLENDNADHLFQIDWSCKLLEEEEPAWVDFKGLWGKATIFAGESGPTGPKWTYYSRNGEQLERDRWQLEEWKDKLLLEILNNSEVKADLRKKALNALVKTIQHNHSE